jgi:hypothetical protein
MNTRAIALSLLAVWMGLGGAPFAVRADEKSRALPPLYPETLAERPSLRVDGHDFPTLARTGLHSSAELARLVAITGRSLAEIEAAFPGRLDEALTGHFAR